MVKREYAVRSFTRLREEMRRLFILFLSITRLYATESRSADLLAQLHWCNDCSVIALVDERYYLNPDSVSMVSGRICLHSDSMGLIVLSALFQDELGLYVEEEGFWYMCERCQTHYPYLLRECDICGGNSFLRVETLPSR